MTLRMDTFVLAARLTHYGSAAWQRYGRRVECHDAVPTAFQLSAARYGLNQIRGLIELDGKRFAYRLTRKGTKTALAAKAGTRRERSSTALGRW